MSKEKKKNPVSGSEEVESTLGQPVLPREQDVSMPQLQPNFDAATGSWLLHSTQIAIQPFHTDIPNATEVRQIQVVIYLVHLVVPQLV